MLVLPREAVPTPERGRGPHRVTSQRQLVRASFCASLFSGSQLNLGRHGLYVHPPVVYSFLPHQPGSFLLGLAGLLPLN